MRQLKMKISPVNQIKKNLKLQVKLSELFFEARLLQRSYSFLSGTMQGCVAGQARGRGLGPIVPVKREGDSTPLSQYAGPPTSNVINALLPRCLEGVVAGV